MLLRYFELDMPNASNKEEIMDVIVEQDIPFVGDGAGKTIEWKWVRREFVLATRCMTAMFERLFGKFKTEGCRKILVECVDVITNDGVANFSGIYVAQIKFNILEFISLTDLEKKKYSLHLLKEGIEKVAEFKGWPLTPFETAFTKIIEANYMNEWVWYKPVKSPDGQHTAEILCQHEVKSMNIFMVIKDKKGTFLGKQILISDQPHEFDYDPYFGEIVWLSDVLVALVNKHGDQSGEVDIREMMN